MKHVYEQSVISNKRQDSAIRSETALKKSTR